MAEATAVNLNGIKTRLAIGLSTCFIKGKPVFIDGFKSLTRNSPDCVILDS